MEPRFEVFGGVRAIGPDGPFELQSQVRRLLGVLLAERRTAVPVARIVDRLWASDPPATAIKVVHVSVGRLRRALTPDAPGDPLTSIVRTTPDGYLLDASDIDLDDYEHSRRRAEDLAPESPDAAFTAAERARSLWRGLPWGAQADDPWLRTEVDALEERHRHLEEIWADLALQCGRATSVIEDLRAAAAREPLRERRWMQLMLALYRAGRQTDALREYERARAILREEIGIEPNPELRQLELAILQQDPSLMRTPAESDAWLAPSSFVGRDADLATLGRALDRDRLITIVGLGGIGKTRLADEFLHRHRASTSSVRVSLSGLESADRFAAHVANQVGVFVDDDPLVNVLAAFIGDRPTVLIIDAAESWTDEVGTLVLGLLPLAARLRVIVTSRVPLGIGVERTVRLSRIQESRPGEPLAGTDLELMIDRMGFDEAALDEDTLQQLQHACAVAGGVPLLIELAARSFEPGTARAPHPDGGADDLDVVRAAISHSLESVDGQARDLLRVGSILPGGMSERTGAELAGLDRDTTRRSLRQLAWLHLVDAHPARASLRYRSLDPIREALLADLDPQRRDEAAASASRAIQNVVDQLWPDHLQPVDAAVLDDVAEEHDNLRFLLADRMTHDPVTALELAIAASDFWAIRGHGIEGRAWLNDAINAAQPEHLLRGRAVLALVRATRTLGEVAQLREQLESICAQVRSERDDAVLLGGLLIYLAIARGWQGDRAGAAQALDEAESLDRAIGSEWSAATLDHVRALDRALTGDFVGARDQQRVFARRMVELGDPLSAAMGWYLAATMGDMGGRTDILPDITASRELATTTKDVALLCQLLRLEASLLVRSAETRSQALMAEAVEQLEASGGIRAAALARRDLGLLALKTGDLDGAATQLNRAVPALIRLDRSATAPALAGMARLASLRNDPRTATALVASASAMRQANAPRSLDDESRTQELLESIEPTEPGAAPADDEQILELCARVAAR